MNQVLKIAGFSTHSRIPFKLIATELTFTNFTIGAWIVKLRKDRPPALCTGIRLHYSLHPLQQ